MSSHDACHDVTQLCTWLYQHFEIRARRWLSSEVDLRTAAVSTSTLRFVVHCDNCLDLPASELDAVLAEVPRYVMCAALPFGYQNAPFLFQKIMIEISRDLKENYRELGLDVPPIVIVYLDDWLLLGANQVEMRKAQAVVDKLLAAYGIQRQVTKGVWPPGGVQILEHLGVGVNLQQGVFYVPPKRMARIRQQARSILTSAARNRGLVDALWLA